jgi:Holliday junction resolvase RusA-like endonuclease
MMGKSPHSGPVAAEFLFTLPESKVRKDLDNLIKGTMDGLKNIVFVDDDQVMRLQAEKRYTKNRKIIEPGVHIVVRSITE